MTSTETRSHDVTPTFTESLLTHIALPVRDLEATLAFYAKYTKLVNIHERQDPETGLRTAWLANARDITDAGARFVIVLIHGKLPTNITGDIKEQYGFLKSISHLGISVESRAEVDRLGGDGARRRVPAARPDVPQRGRRLHLRRHRSRRQQHRVLGRAGARLTLSARELVGARAASPRPRGRVA